MEIIRTAIVDDNPEFRDSLATFLQHAPGFALAEVFVAAAPVLEAAMRLHAGEREPPWDLVLMDIEMPRIDGIETTRRLRELFPELPIVMLTVFEDPRTILRAITAGANGYVLKKSSARELAAQLRAILDGGAPLSPAVASALLDVVRGLGQGAFNNHAPGPASPSRVDLTDREQEVLRALVRGSTYQQAADDLGISIGTVRTHVRAVYKKLQVNSVAQAVRKALDAGIC